MRFFLLLIFFSLSRIATAQTPSDSLMKSADVIVLAQLSSPDSCPGGACGNFVPESYYHCPYRFYEKVYTVHDLPAGLILNGYYFLFLRAENQDYHLIKGGIFFHTKAIEELLAKKIFTEQARADSGYHSGYPFPENESVSPVVMRELLLHTGPHKLQPLLQQDVAERLAMPNIGLADKRALFGYIDATKPRAALVPLINLLSTDNKSLHLIEDNGFSVYTILFSYVQRDPEAYLEALEQSASPEAYRTAAWLYAQLVRVNNTKVSEAELYHLSCQKNLETFRKRKSHIPEKLKPGYEQFLQDFEKEVERSAILTR